MTKYVRYFDHECDLPTIVETCMQEHPPYTPNYKRWFYSWRRFFIVDEESSRAKRFFRSYASLMAEKRRHATGKHYKIIHPFSKCAIYRERIVCILWMISFFLDPVRISFFMACDMTHVLFTIQWAMDFIFLFNVIMSCFIGYCNTYTKEIVLSPRGIFRSRMFSFFIPETLACIPAKQIAMMITSLDPKMTRISTLNVFRLFRFLRLLEMIRYLADILEELKIPEAISTITIVFLMSLYVIHWLGCILYFVSISTYTWEYLPEKSWLYVDSGGDPDRLHVLMCAGNNNTFYNLFVLVVIRATCHFFGASEGYKPIILNIEKLACSFVIIIGFIYCNYATAKVLELFGSVNISESKYEEHIHQLTEYVRSKNIPESLKKRLITYYEYKYQKKFFKEEEIMATLSDHLRCEVMLYTCKNVLEKVPLFYGMSRASMGSIIGFMKREIYLPNDVVQKYGEPLLKMSWVSHGTLAVYYGQESAEILHFEDGDHFGDLSITKKGGIGALSIVALEISEIFTLARKDITHCTSFLHEMSERVLRVEKEKSQMYSLLGSVMNLEESQNRVLADLRKGRILEKDRMRKRRMQRMDQ